MRQYAIRSLCFLAVTTCAVMNAARAQVAIERTDIESWVDVPVTSHAWDVNSNVSGSAMPDTAGLAGILAGGDADFRTIVKDLKRNLTSVLKRMPMDVMGADSFPNATHVEQVSFVRAGGNDSIIYRFSLLANTSLTQMGLATDQIDTDQDGTRDTIVARYVPAGWRDRELPADSGKMWMTGFVQEIWMDVASIGPRKVIATDEDREYHVMRTASLVTPNGAAPAIVLHAYEFITYPFGGSGTMLERFSFIKKNGEAVTVSYKLDNRQNRQRTGLNDIAWFVPQGSSSVTVHGTSGVPDDVQLEQNHPNPGTSRTNIPFTLKRAGHVRVTVYDALGREVAGLLDAPVPAGAHNVEFRTGGLAPGLYTYRLQMDDVVLSRKMMVRN